MNVIRRLFDFYLRSSLHVGMSLGALFLTYHPQLSITNSWKFIVPLFCLTVAGYNVTKYASLALRKVSFPFEKGIKIITLLAMVGIIPFFLKINMSSLLVLSSVVLFGLLYTFPVLGGKSLRHFPIVKLLAVAVVWVLLALTLPSFIDSAYYFNGEFLTHRNNAYHENYVLSFKSLQLFLFVIALCIPFEIRDLKYDHEDLKTLPQLIGVKWSSLIGILLCGICILLESNYYFKYGQHISLVNAAAFTGTIVLILFSTRSRPDYYASFWVEAVPIFWWMGIIVAG